MPLFEGGIARRAVDGRTTSASIVSLESFTEIHWVFCPTDTDTDTDEHRHRVTGTGAHPPAGSAYHLT
jgi:hypothetical protein